MLLSTETGGTLSRNFWNLNSWEASSVFTGKTMKTFLAIFGLHAAVEAKKNTLAQTALLSFIVIVVLVVIAAAIANFLRAKMGKNRE